MITFHQLYSVLSNLIFFHKKIWNQIFILANGNLLDEKTDFKEKIRMLTNTNKKDESLSKNTIKLLTCTKAES